ncbi:unnamed protein product [Didymodactylos carnosus]|uniref:Uncharacterized protein n=2 Tax=Didymodactylos carnosus TaxID=1234261 RepID=A0A814VPP5_9BILA|nr:unnamed protein product [Didymodactylos carnosus]CAF3955505.1 unnamed protein product [Didymodactylos carnosus]
MFLETPEDAQPGDAAAEDVGVPAAPVPKVAEEGDAVAVFAVEYDRALPHQYYLVEELQHLGGWLVDGHQHRLGKHLQLAQSLEDVQGVERVQAAGRLAQEQHRRVVQQLNPNTQLI